MALLETLLLVSSGLKAAGGVINFFGNRSAANDADREGRRLAKDAIERGERDVDLHEMDLAQLLGTQRTNIAASGIDTNFGSAAQLRDQTVRFGAEDVNTIRENAAREAYALRRGGRAQAQQLRMQATGDILGAAGTVLSMGANAWDVRQRNRSSARTAVSQTRQLMGDRSRGYSQGLQSQYFGGR